MTRPKTLDLSAAMIHTSPMLRRVIGENIELVMLPGEDLPSVFIDLGRIQFYARPAVKRRYGCVK